ncbi:MAG: cation transporter [Ruminococcaceae bacterium]|nr:cation transporter [Oscillospiraceae bacterium]
MSELLFKIFIKDHANTTDAKVREKYGTLGGMAGIIINVMLCIIKFFAGIISASVSLLADSFNNLSDALSSIITLVGFKMAGKPADKQHPYGHGRIEYISALLVSIVILFMGYELMRSSFDKIIDAQTIIYSNVSIIILIISILTKLWMFFFNRKIGKTINSQAIIAAAKDSLGDCVATLAVLCGMLIFRFSGYCVDGYIGLIVACFILFTGYQTIRDSLSPLLGQPPETELVGQIEALVLSHEGIIGMHDLIIHNYGPTRFMLSLHAEVRASDNVLELHDTIDLIEKELCTRYGCDAVIHMDPIETDNEIINHARQVVADIIASIDTRLSMHDFRMVTGPTHTNLIFDLVVPFDFDISDAQLLSRIQDKIFDFDKNYFVVISIDKNYV